MAEFRVRKGRHQARKKVGETDEDAVPATPDPPTPSTPASGSTTPAATPTSTPAATPTATPATPTATPTNGSEKRTPASEKPKPTVLSFDNEEGEEEFQVKKSHRSKKVVKEIKDNKDHRPLIRDLPTIVSTATAVHSIGAGEYTPEKLEALRKNAKSYISRPKQEEESVIDVEPEIPTAEQIHEARNRRTRMREGKDDDFIPLDKGSTSSGGRLVRDEGEDDDLDEEGRDSDARIGFAGIKKQTKPVVEFDDVEVEDDDETRRWEMDRIRRGVGAHELKKRDLVEKARPATKSPARAPLDLSGSTNTTTIETITKDIRSTLTGLQEAHRSHVAQLERVNEELQTVAQNATELEEQVKHGASEYSFFAGMKIYVADLLDCLGAKAELVEKAEDQLLAAHRVHNAKNRAHAQRKLEETAQEMKGIADEAAGYVAPGTTKLRERKAKSTKPRARGAEEGWSSDSESEEVNEEFKKSAAAAKEAGKAVFEDVDEQYSSISVIKEKFEAWKKDYSISYRQAYISLSMPQLFSPFVRLQLLTREPLQDGLDTMDWYKDLFEYGLGAEGATEDDDDNFLVPRLVEKVVVPRVQDALAHAWNPQSRKNNSRALASVIEVLTYADAGDGHVKELFAGVLGGLQNAVSEIGVPIFPSPKDKDEKNNLPWEFSCRMMWRAIKLLKNVTGWHEVLAAVPLQHLSLETLLNTKILPFLRTLKDLPSLYLDACESITSAIPSNWFSYSGDGSGGGVNPSLLLFLDPLQRVARKLEDEDKKERSHRDRNRDQEKERERNIARAMRMLVKLNDHETARSISKSTSIKIPV